MVKCEEKMRLSFSFLSFFLVGNGVVLIQILKMKRGEGRKRRINYTLSIRIKVVLL